MVRRSLILLLSVVTICVAASAADKVIERSAKKVPSWLTDGAEGFEVVTVEATSLAEAQRAALDALVERIIRAVASNVSLSQQSVICESIADGEVVDSRDEFSRVSRIRAARLPFLKGVSLSCATDVYWLRLRDRKTGEEHYEYSVKYPFSRVDREMLVAEYEELDRTHDAALRAYEDEIQTFGAYEDIAESVDALDALARFFIDDVRISRAEALKKRYGDLYSTLGIAGNVVGGNVIECCLTVGGRPVRCATPPTATSECACSFVVSPTESGIYRVEFDTADCLPDETNTVQVTWRLGSNRVRRVFRIGDDDERFR